MIPFVLILRQFLRALRRAVQDPTFQLLALLTSILLALGTVFYHAIEGWSWLDSLYFCVITLATVGYGDFSPATAAGKLFTMIYVFMGIGLMVAVFSRLAESLLETQGGRLGRHSSGSGRKRDREL
jgi:voltage-gated potassium channel